MLEKDHKNVQIKFNALELLESRQKKTTRETIQLKRKKLLEMGIDIDHATF